MPVLLERMFFLERLHTRIERSCAARGVDYPWWIPALSSYGTAVLTVAAVVQRHALFPPTPIALAGLLAITSILVWAVTGWLAPPWLEAIATTVAVALLLTHPAVPDFGPFLLVVMAAEVAATSPLLVATAASAAGIAVVVVAGSVGHLAGSPLYVVGVVMGLDVGIALRWQMRALRAERANSLIVRQQAVLAERQRLAREVHDIAGHSLSITLLHVTGARHSLQRHADIPDAISALTEAERVGRAAMADLRRSVGVLASERSATTALPGLDDLPALVERSRAAGLDVRFEQAGDLCQIDAATGLGLYRVAQESLANIAKHAPSEAASICLEVGGAATRLTVLNSLPAGKTVAATDGSGLAGMAARAEQMGASLHAGPDGGRWIVELVLPVSS